MLETSLFVATVAALGMLSPGPDFFLVIKNAVRFHRPAAMMTAIRITLKSAFLQGYLCNLLNPKATLFFLAVFTQILQINSSVGEKLWYDSIIWGLAIIWWPLLVILIQSAPIRSVLTKTQKWVDKLLGGLLIVLGIKVALS